MPALMCLEKGTALRGSLQAFMQRNDQRRVPATWQVTFADLPAPCEQEARTGF
jgi:hypothetical protein